MASSFETYSIAEDETHPVIDQKKRKRMISNRESARRSRMRKQKHLDDLMAQKRQLRTDNDQLFTAINITTQIHSEIEAENSILRAQVAELSQRLESLNEIIEFLHVSNDPFGINGMEITDGGCMNPWNSLYVHQPIMAAPDLFMH